MPHELYQPYTFGTSLAQAEREDLVTLATQRPFSEGQELLSQGDVTDFVVIICRGGAKVVSGSSKECRVLLGLRGPGDLLGEMRFLSGAPRNASVVATTGGTALVVDFHSLTTFCRRHARVGLEIARCVSDRLSWSDRRRVDFCHSVTTRVARVLYELGCEILATRNGSRLVGPLDIPITQRELGQLVGAAEVSVQKSLRQLAKIGGVVRRYGRVSITRLDLLRTYSDEGREGDFAGSSSAYHEDRPNAPWGL